MGIRLCTYEGPQEAEHAGKVGDDNESDDSEMLLPDLLCHTTRRAHKALKILYVDYGLSIHPESVGINSKLILSYEVCPILRGGVWWGLRPLDHLYLV